MNFKKAVGLLVSTILTVIAMSNMVFGMDHYYNTVLEQNKEIYSSQRSDEEALLWYTLTDEDDIFDFDNLESFQKYGDKLFEDTRMIELITLTTEKVNIRTIAMQFYS